MSKKRIITIACAPVIALVIALLLSSAMSSRADFGKDFQTNGTVLVKYCGTDSSVVVPEGITSIDSNAFANNPLITSVVLPDTVKSIGNNSFSDCINLQEINIPDSADSIGESAFSGCINLYDVSIGSRLSLMGSGAFAGCSKLRDVDIASDNNFFVCEGGVIYSKDKKKLFSYLAGNSYTNYVMPNEVEEISRYAFFGVASLKNIVTSSNLKKVNDYAFFNMPNLETITINLPANSINMGAFQSCPNLKQVVMPASVVNIYQNSFGTGNNELTFICDKNSYAYKFAKDNNIKVSESPVINTDSYKDDRTAKKETKEENLDEAHTTVKDSSELDINNNIQIAEEYVRSVGNSTIVSDRAFVMMDDLIVYSGQSTNNNNENKDSIDDYALYASKVESFSFGDEPIRTIGKLAFARSSLKTIIIPDSVTTIGYGAFYHCDNLEEIIIPDSVNRIDAYAFDHTPFYNNYLNSGNDFLIVGNGVLVKYNGNDEEVVIPDNVKYISTYAFKDNNMIKSVTFNDDLLIINDYAFDNCSSLSMITNIPEKCIKSDNSFVNCELLAN